MTRRCVVVGAATSSSPWVGRRRRIAGLATKNRPPSIGGLSEYTEAGGLMVYSPNTLELERGVATYVNKILRGARPADLPIEQPTKLDLAINLRTARALGLTIPLRSCCARTR